MRARLLWHVLFTIAAVGGLVLGGSASASAAVGVPPMGILASSDSSGVTLCATGSSTAAINAWVFTVEGVRADGSVVREVHNGGGRSFSSCVTVTVNGTVTGGGTATLSYAGSGPEVAGTF